MACKKTKEIHVGMMNLILDMNTNNTIKFISYNGSYPNLCYGGCIR